MDTSRMHQQTQLVFDPQVDWQPMYTQTVLPWCGHMTQVLVQVWQQHFGLVIADLADTL